MHLSLQLILLPPLLMAAFSGLLGLFMPAWREQKTLVGALATAAVALPFGVAVMLFLGFEEAAVVSFYEWLHVGDLAVDFAYRVDELSLLMTLVVTGIGALIHVYSMGYMKDDAGYWRFFAYLNLFIFAMLNLVLAENLVVLFLGWEGVGLCSYLLIGFWYEDGKKVIAANKAFIVNRIGDAAFLLGMFLLFQRVVALPEIAGTGEGFGLDFATLLSADVLAALAADGTAAIAVLLLFIGATGKSAQIPLFTWLPDAMAGPTPVSALIHAATMVTAGLYLLARLSELVLLAPTMMLVVCVIGGLTAIIAATIAMVQTDIKKVLAYSTVSQLGYMFMAAGAGAFVAAIFHVFTHAFFKACLFLGSGSVIHAMHEVEHDLEHRGTKPALFDAQDMRTMGGLKKYMPQTRITFLIATLAIAGIPLLAGYFSKDEILFKVFEAGMDGTPLYLAVWGVGLATALLTAFYMTRAYMLTFEGEPRWPEADTVKPHESPATMTLPLWVLAIGSALVGFLGLPLAVTKTMDLPNVMHDWLAGHGDHVGPVAELKTEYHASLPLEWALLALGAAIAILGVGFAWRFYARGLDADAALKQRLGGLHGTFSRGWGIDAFYRVVVVGVVKSFARDALDPLDKTVLDRGLVEGGAQGVRGLGGFLARLQNGIAQTYAAVLVAGVLL
ncbi:MAG: NADH-quinone oxidoreductase subunit L, partial [Bacteroidota bacterium]